jgi:hypothetical protein
MFGEAYKLRPTETNENTWVSSHFKSVCFVCTDKRRTEKRLTQRETKERKGKERRKD